MHGGQGSVTIEYNEPLGIDVACKHMLNPSDADVVKRFQREIDIIQKIDHYISVFDVKHNFKQINRICPDWI